MLHKSSRVAKRLPTYSGCSTKASECYRKLQNGPASTRMLQQAPERSQWLKTAPEWPSRMRKTTQGSRRLQHVPDGSRKHSNAPEYFRRLQRAAECARRFRMLQKDPGCSGRLQHGSEGSRMLQKANMDFTQGPPLVLVIFLFIFLLSRDCLGLLVRT